MFFLFIKDNLPIQSSPFPIIKVFSKSIIDLLGIGISEISLKRVLLSSTLSTSTSGLSYFDVFDCC